jgi:hypothetical protein
VGAGREASSKLSTSKSKDASIIRKAKRSRSGSREGSQRLTVLQQQQGRQHHQESQQKQKWEQGGKPAVNGPPATARMPASSGKLTEAGVGAGREVSGKWSTSNSKDASIIRKANRSRSGSREGSHGKWSTSTSKNASITRKANRSRSGSMERSQR